MCLHRLATYSAIGALSLLLAACGENTQPDPRTNVPLVRVAAVQHATPAARVAINLLSICDWPCGTCALHNSRPNCP